MLQAVLDQILGHYAGKGFNLEEDDHLVNLYFKDNYIASFSANGVRLIDILDACRDYWDKLNEGDNG